MLQLFRPNHFFYSGTPPRQMSSEQLTHLCEPLKLFHGTRPLKCSLSSSPCRTSKLPARKEETKQPHQSLLLQRLTAPRSCLPRSLHPLDSTIHVLPNLSQQQNHFLSRLPDVNQLRPSANFLLVPPVILDLRVLQGPFVSQAQSQVVALSCLCDELCVVVAKIQNRPETHIVHSPTGTNSLLRL